MENIAEQIERHKQGMKKVRRAIPLVMVVVCANFYFMEFSETTRESRNSWIILAALCIYCSVFIYSYFNHKNKLKKLEQSL